MGLILGSQNLASVGSLQFSGSGGVSYDRVNIPLTGAANFGNTDFSLEMWLRPTASNTNTGTTSQDGNIVIDRDNSTGGVSGQMIVGIRNNVFCVGISPDVSTDYTEYSCTTAVNDGAWHHFLISRDESTGDVNIYVDGTREVDAAGPSGDIRWISGGDAEDQRMVLGVEKIGFTGLSYFGHMTELRARSIYIDTASITVPTARIGSDGNTLVYYDFSEGSGTVLTDLGPSADSDGTVVFNAGSPPPTWDTINPYA